MEQTDGLAWVHGGEAVNNGITKDYFNYTQMTEGEFSLQLAASQLRLLQQAHPSDDYVKTWKKGEEYLMLAIYNGLHGTKNAAMPSGWIDPVLYPVIEKIKTAQNRFQTAYKGGIYLNNRSSQAFGTNPLDQLEPHNWSNINGYPYQSGCQMRYCNSNDNPCTNYTVTGVDKECEKFENIKNMMNQYLEDSSHHVMYNFATNAQAAVLQPTTSWKIGQHILAAVEMAKISGISSANMNDWLQLGIQRNNAKRGLGAINAHDSIEYLIANPDFLLENSDQYKAQYGINGINVIPAIAYVIVACAIALIAITGLIQVLKGQEPTALDRIKGLATALFSPNGSDFPKIGTGGGGSNNCPTGYRYDTALERCVKIETGGGGGGTNCGTGFHYDSVERKCVADKKDSNNTPLLIGAGLLVAYGLSK